MSNSFSWCFEIPNVWCFKPSARPRALTGGEIYEAGFQCCRHGESDDTFVVMSNLNYWQLYPEWGLQQFNNIRGKLVLQAFLSTMNIVQKQFWWRKDQATKERSSHNHNELSRDFLCHSTGWEWLFVYTTFMS